MSSPHLTPDQIAAIRAIDRTAAAVFRHSLDGILDDYLTPEPTIARWDGASNYQKRSLLDVHLPDLQQRSLANIAERFVPDGNSRFKVKVLGKTLQTAVQEGHLPAPRRSVETTYRCAVHLYANSFAAAQKQGHISYTLEEDAAISLLVEYAGLYLRGAYNPPRPDWQAITRELVLQTGISRTPMSVRKHYERHLAPQIEIVPGQPLPRPQKIIFGKEEDDYLQHLAQNPLYHNPAHGPAGDEYNWQRITAALRGKTGILRNPDSVRIHFVRYLRKSTE